MSGSETTIYSVIVGGDNITLFEYFIKENIIAYKNEVINILNRLETIGKTTGAREIFFKHKEGKPGNGVCALYDVPDSKLRLYSIRYGKPVIILGGGGPKPLIIQAWQNDPKLKLEAEEIIKISALIFQLLSSNDLQWSKDGFHLKGELNFTDNDDD